MYLRLILPVIALHGLVLTNDVGIIEQDSLILIESWGSGEETSETTTASPTTTAAYTTMEIITPEVTTTQEPKFNTSEIVIISMFSLFGFLFLLLTLVAAGMHKMGLVMVGLSLIIGTGFLTLLKTKSKKQVGTIGTISYFLYDNKFEDETIGYVLLGTALGTMMVAVAFGALYRR